MLTATSLFVGLLVIYYSYWIYKWRNPTCNGTLPPGSMGFPIIGETFQILVSSYSLDLHPFFKKRLQRYGPIFRSNVAGHSVVVSADEEFNRYVLNNEGRLVEFWYMDSFSKVLGLKTDDANLNSTGYIHKYLRSIVLRQIGSEGLKEKWVSELENFINKTLRSWPSQGTVAVNKAAFSAITNFTAKILFSFDAETSSELFDENLYKLIESLISFPLNVPGTTYYQSLKGKEKALNMVRRIVKERRSSVRKHEEDDILSLMVKDIGKEKFLTEESVSIVLFGVLFAAMETIPIMITSLFNFLSDHPSVIHQLTAEHEDIVKNRKGSNHSITWDEYKSMTFTHQVINEVLRLATLMPGSLRKTTKEIQHKGYTIPAGWTIIMLTFYNHLNPQVYKDPLAFNPWRWKELDSYTISKNFAPFGGGGRQCAGADYSKLSLSIFIHVLVTNHRWTTIKEGKTRRNPILSFKRDTLVKFMEKPKAQH